MNHNHTNTYVNIRIKQNGQQITRTSDGTALQSGQAYLPGEVLWVAFNASALPDEAHRRRLTWVAEASLPSALLPSVDDRALDAAQGESSRTVCNARNVARAVPATGRNHVLWRMPPAVGAGEGSGADVKVALAYAWRYGTVYVTEQVVLRGTFVVCGVWVVGCWLDGLEVLLTCFGVYKLIHTAPSVVAGGGGGGCSSRGGEL